MSDLAKDGQEKYINLRAKVAEEIIQEKIGCLKSCPFCGEICINGENGHQDNHRTPYHRPQGIYGYSWSEDSDPIKAKKLITENCQHLVHGDYRFKNSDTNHQWTSYKDYRQVNSYYASWQINGDPSIEASSYWKWFMATYSYQLAKLYNAVEPDIPGPWKSLNKEKEIEKLRKLIDG